MKWKATRLLPESGQTGSDSGAEIKINRPLGKSDARQ
jgi:hypothetical protein